MSGPYTNTGGITSVICAKQALEDYGVGHQGHERSRCISADHQNKPDLAVSIVAAMVRPGRRRCADGGANSRPSRWRCSRWRGRRTRSYLNVGAATSALTGAQCSPNFIHWCYDTYMLAVDRRRDGEGGRRQLVFHHRRLCLRQAVAGDTTRFVKAAGGKVLGSALYPFPGTRISRRSWCRRSRSGAKVLGLAQRRRRHGELDQAGA